MSGKSESRAGLEKYSALIKEIEALEQKGEKSGTLKNGETWLREGRKIILEKEDYRSIGWEKAIIEYHENGNIELTQFSTGLSLPVADASGWKTSESYDIENRYIYTKDGQLTHEEERRGAHFKRIADYENGQKIYETEESSTSGAGLNSALKQAIQQSPWNKAEKHKGGIFSGQVSSQAGSGSSGPSEHLDLKGKLETHSKEISNHLKDNYKHLITQDLQASKTGSVQYETTEKKYDTPESRAGNAPSLENKETVQFNQDGSHFYESAQLRVEGLNQLTERYKATLDAEGNLSMSYVYSVNDKMNRQVTLTQTANDETFTDRKRNGGRFHVETVKTINTGEQKGQYTVTNQTETEKRQILSGDETTYSKNGQVISRKKYLPEEGKYVEVDMDGKPLPPKPGSETPDAPPQPQQQEQNQDAALSLKRSPDAINPVPQPGLKP
ncbi:MAG: hypothetical protein ACT4OY_06100 [Alphaproteobacteria bacterium]